MSSAWVNTPGIGAFVLFSEEPASTPELCCALIRDLLEGLGLGERDVQITASATAKWRGFAWKSIDQAISNPAIRSIALLVGTPSEVHLGGRIALRRDAAYMTATDPLRSWVVAETTRWSPERIALVCRRWLRDAAERGVVQSGGVAAHPNLLGLKNEVSGEREDEVAFVPVSAAYMLHRSRVDGDRPWEIAKRGFRRLYPVTLLGPRFSSPNNADLLRAAGAKVEVVGRSLVVDTYPEVVPVWSPEYLAATVALRRLAWPISVQNPADAVGLGLKARFEAPRYVEPPSWEPPFEEVVKELKRQTKAFEALVAAQPPAPELAGALVVTETT